MEKAEEKRDSLNASLNGDGRPPSYVEQAPRQEPFPDLSARLAQLSLNPIVGVSYDNLRLLSVLNIDR
jgi:hypothetical protein